MVKEDLIEVMLKNTDDEDRVSFTADGHDVVIIKIDEDSIYITIDGENSTSDDVLKYNHIVLANKRGAWELDFTEEYDLLSSPYNKGVLVAKNVGQIVVLFGKATKVTVPEPVISVARFECLSCMRLRDIAQYTEQLCKPNVCYECGGKTFKLDHECSEYKEKQYIHLSVDQFPYPIPVILSGSRCSYNHYQEDHYYYFKGVLAVDYTDTRNTYYLKYADDVTGLMMR